MSEARALKPHGQTHLQALPATGGGIIYGPFPHELYGQALGINLLGNEKKICSFNCVYCDLGKTELRLNQLKSSSALPSFEDTERAIQEAFQKIHASGPAVDTVIVSGNGEPTLHPEFPEIAKQIVAARERWLPGRPIVLYTNGVGLDTRKVFDSANLFDERIVKIDAGGDRLFKAVNAPLSRTNLARILNGIRNLKDVIIQSLFFEGDVTNTKPSDVDEWLEVIAIVKPKGVQIHGLTRTPTSPGLVRCHEDTLYAIASRLERKTQIKAIVLP